MTIPKSPKRIPPPVGLLPDDERDPFDWRVPVAVVTVVSVLAALIYILGVVADYTGSAYECRRVVMERLVLDGYELDVADWVARNDCVKSWQFNPTDWRW